jgi:hypothetical protein
MSLKSAAHSLDASASRSSCRSGDPFSSHLFADDAGVQAIAFDFQQVLRVDTREDIEQWCDQAGPSRLMTRAESCAVVAMEVLVEQN